MIDLFPGDCMEVLRNFLPNTVDACITDPPYHLQSIVKRFGAENAAPAKFGSDGAFSRASRGFMGKQWDGGDIAQNPEMWRLVWEAMKPGAHLLAFGGTRTSHRMVCAIEDAGFEIRDTLMWVYGSGFPKSHDVSKGIDKAAGAKREVIGTKIGLPGYSLNQCADPGGVAMEGNVDGSLRNPMKECEITQAATPEAQQWEGWGTALKPALEPIVLARKPLSEKTVAANVLKWDTGAINIDGCRITANKGKEPMQWETPRGGIWSTDTKAQSILVPNPKGRWPANLIHDGSEEVMDFFPNARGQIAMAKTDGSPQGNKIFSPMKHGTINPEPRDEGGSAARFFYCAKANKKDRNGSKHPTVKPIALLRYLCRLITPPGGRILDPFAGSGTLGEAAHLEGFNAALIEREAEYVEDIRRRLAGLS